MASTSEHKAHLSHPKYRPDIDGLRAIAVLSVVVFHAFPAWLQGGFIGVDIFFVISGYLISTIILESLSRNSFSFSEFYSRRIRRIFPSLILVLIASFVFGWFVLITGEYKQLGKHIAGGAGFISNFLFWNESGYFDNAAETKPLLHLWTLGIEEQFYIVWPCLLWLAWKTRFKLWAMMVALAAISFAFNIHYIGNDKVAAFYSPQARFWELLSGAMLAQLTLRGQPLFSGFRQQLDHGLAQLTLARRVGINTHNLQSALGLTLIVTGFAAIDKTSAFPGWWVLLPVIGTLLVIAAGNQAWLNRTVLSNRVLVWFGLISYPLYLWHWPLLSFAHIVETGAPSTTLMLTLVAAAIALAWLTYVLVEKHIRFGGHGALKTTGLVTLMVIVGYTGYNCYERDGLGFRLKDRQAFSEYFENTPPEWRYLKKIDYYRMYREDCSFFNDEEFRAGHATQAPRSEINPACYVRNGASHAVFIWGDSHAQQINYGLAKHLPPDWQVLQVASSDCMPDADVTGPSTTSYCDQSNWFALKAISESRPDVVIVAQSIGHNLNTFNLLAEKLQTLGVRRIIFNGAAPHWKVDLPKLIISKMWFNTPQRSFVGTNPVSFTNNAKLKAQFAPSDNVQFASLIDCFCNEEGCLTYIGNDKKTGIVSWDKGHLTPIASEYLAENLLVGLVTGSK